jgi:pimeloyl-ACP methyl ester carboxylesterase
MGLVQRPDGAEIEWQERGDGPPVALSNIGYAGPVLIEGLAADLARDHRVLTWHTRGTGGSSRLGPYTVEIDAGDLTAVLEAAGAEGCVTVGNGDGVDRAIEAATRRPDLIDAVVAPGGVAAGGRGSAGLSSSTSVLEALLMLLENDYRAGVHAFVSSGNPGLADEAIQQRVHQIVAYSSQEATVGRIRSWINNEPADDARALGDRLWLLHHDANPWFADTEGSKALFPDAHHEHVQDGAFTRPDLTAAAVRRITGAGG